MDDKPMDNDVEALQLIADYRKAYRTLRTAAKGAIKRSA
jgi:hypothetical protein